MNLWLRFMRGWISVCLALRKRIVINYYINITISVVIFYKTSSSLGALLPHVIFIKGKYTSVKVLTANLDAEISSWLAPQNIIQ